MGFDEQLRLVWRHRFWLLAFSLLAAIAVFIFASLRASEYTASAVVGVTPGVTPGSTVNNDTVSFATKYYERLVRSDTVLTAGAAAAGPDTSVEDMRSRIGATSALANGTVTVTAKDSNAEESVKVATAVANATIAQGQKDQQDRRSATLAALQTEQDALKAQLDALPNDSLDRSRLEAQYQSTVQSIADQQNAPFDTAQLLESPVLPKSPGGPGSTSLALFAFLAAFILGAEALVVLVRLRRRQEPEAEQAPAAAPEPALDAERMRVPLLPFDTALPDLLLDSIAGGHRLIGIVGAGDFAATNEVTLALGEELALSGHPTLVVEGDMTHPTLASRLSIRSQAGLTDVLAGGATLDRTQRPTSVPGLFVLPAGRQVERPDVLVGVDNVQHALSTSSCDVVLVALPPSMSPDERHRTASQLHAVVSVVRDGRMRARQVRSALAELGDLHHILVGVGLVDVLPNPEVEVVSRRPERASGKRTTNGDGVKAPAVEREAEPEPAPQDEPDTSPFAPTRNGGDLHPADDPQHPADDPQHPADDPQHPADDPQYPAEDPLPRG